jgi:heterodisulfide reductase subunit B
MNKQKYALFIGCTIAVRGLNYELSARKVGEVLGIEFIDIQEFSCCGFPLGSIHHSSGVTIAARNLALAEAKGLDIITLCSACTGYLTEVKRKLSNDKDGKLLKEVNKKLKDLGYQYNGGVKIKHFARVLYEDIGL